MENRAGLKSEMDRNFKSEMGDGRVLCLKRGRAAMPRQRLLPGYSRVILLPSAPTEARNADTLVLGWL